jgi:hypothetical protein
MSVLPVKGKEIMEPTQLESHRSNLYNSSYEINKSGVSAVLTDSRTSKFSGLTLCICNLNLLILDIMKLMKFLNFSNWFYLNWRSIARDIK